MSEIYTMNLDTRSSKGYPLMTFVKGDVGTNKIEISLTSNNVTLDLTGKTVTFTIRKPDNTEVVYNANITGTNTVEFILDANALASVGTVICTVEVYDGVQRITSVRFQYKVIDSLNSSDDIASFSDYPVLTSLINDVQTAKEDIGTIGSLKDELTTKITDGDALNTNLGNNITSGTTLNNDLESNINTGTTLKSDLENNINTGNTTKSGLDASISTGDSLKSSLETDINTAGTKKTDLENVIATADTTTYATKGETGLIANLTTTDKTNLVAAINEHGSQLAEQANQITGLQNSGVDLVARRNLSDITTLGINLFDKTTISSGKFINYLTGEISDSTDYFVSDYIPCLSSNSYILSGAVSGYRRLVYYDINKVVISGVDQPTTFTTPSNAVYIKFCTALTELNTTQIEKGTVASAYANYGVVLSEDALKEYRKGRNKIYTLSDAYVAWKNGEKFPVAFFGDSTVDGAQTTDWVQNVLGTDNTSPNAFPMVLQNYLRTFIGGTTLRIYNAGFFGNTASWANSHVSDEFGDGKPYADVKMVGIGFGINDRLDYATEKEYRTSFKSSILSLIDWFYSYNIQPFLLTTQSTLEPETTTAYPTYTWRNSRTIEAIANEIKREIADEYNLELIDFNKYTEEYLTYSLEPIINIIASDHLHFKDKGHIYEAGLTFAHIIPFVNFVSEKTQIDYTIQKLTSGIANDLLTDLGSFSDTFKTVANYTKSDSTDTKIMSAYVFVEGHKQLTLKAYKSVTESLTYVKVDGVVTNLSTLETVLSNLDLGLHTLEVWSGTSTKVDFKGFILE